MLIIRSGDKPLTDALELMNNEGVTSLPVLDAQNNVIGNISHVDVRVSRLHHVRVREKRLTITAPDKNYIATAASLFLHTLHRRHSQRARRERRKRLFPCVSHHTLLDSCTYCCQTRRYPFPPYVDCRCALSRVFRSTDTVCKSHRNVFTSA